MQAFIFRYNLKLAGELLARSVCLRSKARCPSNFQNISSLIFCYFLYLQTMHSASFAVIVTEMNPGINMCKAKIVTSISDHDSIQNGAIVMTVEQKNTKEFYERFCNAPFVAMRLNDYRPFYFYFRIFDLITINVVPKRRLKK